MDQSVELIVLKIQSKQNHLLGQLKKLEEMIPAHVETVKSLSNVVVN
jgi:uncharacterized protein YaaN involved in tellurite resistance